MTTSIYSHPFGIPVAVAGLAWSFVMLLLCSPQGWRASARWVSPVRLAGSLSGVGMVLYLVYRELFSLGRLCEYCTVVHVMTIALFIVVALPPSASRRSTRTRKTWTSPRSARQARRPPRASPPHDGRGPIPCRLASRATGT